MKKPAKKKKLTLTLRFDTKSGIENFIAIYLDGGGADTMGYYAKDWGKTWMYLKSMGPCPKCEYPDPYFWDKPHQNGEKVTCANCGHEFILKC